jgi:hypothetical protein
LAACAAIGGLISVNFSMVSRRFGVGGQNVNKVSAIRYFDVRVLTWTTMTMRCGSWDLLVFQGLQQHHCTQNKTAWVVDAPAGVDGVCARHDADRPSTRWREKSKGKIAW